MSYKEYYCCPVCGIIDTIYAHGMTEKSFSEVVRHSEILDYEEDVEQTTYYTEITCHNCYTTIYEFPDYDYDCIPDDLKVIVKNKEYTIGDLFRKIYTDYLKNENIEYDLEDLDKMIIEDIIRFELDNSE